MKRVVALPPETRAGMSSIKAETLAPNKRKLFVKSYGCQMNVYDASRMADVLAPEGYDETNSPDEADLVILNTCHIRERASEKIFSELGKFRDIKLERQARGKDTMIAVAGCVAQAEGKEILRRQKAVDLVVGPQNYHRLPDLLHKARTTGRVVDTEFPPEDKFDFLNRPSAEKTRSRGVTSFLTIQEGCDKFCTFCVVPYTRGAEVSRSAAKILSEAQDLAAAGVWELTLLGQNVNAYHGEGLNGKVWPFERLAEEISKIEGIKRIRYSTSHPRDMTDGLIKAHRDLPALMPSLHLPVQSGSDRILTAMNRDHSRARYLDIIGALRQSRPDIALTSDFIVGFPGESDEDFADTLDLIKQVQFSAAYSFKYSPRPGTPAAAIADQIPAHVMAERLSGLQVLVETQRQAFHHAAVGQTLEVLFEKPGRKSGQIGGKSPYLHGVHIEGPIELLGQVRSVEIVASSGTSLEGQLKESQT